MNVCNEIPSTRTLVVDSIYRQSVYTPIVLCLFHVATTRSLGSHPTPVSSTLGLSVLSSSSQKHERAFFNITMVARSRISN
jgi:hypothetical protein